jgi:hypothetical protein
MGNFDNPSFSDFAIAEFIVAGLPDKLKDHTDNFELLIQVTFNYGTFEGKLQQYYNNLPKCTTGRAQSTNQLTQSSAAPPACLTKEETIWQIHFFLDFQGRCHHCKSTCGSFPRAFPNLVNQGYINIPSTFVRPTKPANYKPPNAWTTSHSTAGKPTQAPAGQKPSHLAAVAGVVSQSFLSKKLESSKHKVQQSQKDNKLWPSLKNHNGITGLPSINPQPHSPHETKSSCL